MSLQYIQRISYFSFDFLDSLPQTVQKVNFSAYFRCNNTASDHHKSLLKAPFYKYSIIGVKKEYSLSKHISCI